jgi:transcriptional regulator with XRE-family HTH domain
VANPLPVETVFARRLREVRDLRDLTREGLSKRVRELTGLSISAQVIKTIEGGGERARNVTISELFAFAATLNVAPAHLLTSTDDAETMVVPTRDEIRSDNVRAWIRGLLPLDYTQWGEFVRTWPASELARSLRMSPRPGLDVKRTPSPSGALEGGFVAPEDRGSPQLSEEQVEDRAWEITEGEDQRQGRKGPTREQQRALEADPDEDKEEA